MEEELDDKEDSKDSKVLEDSKDSEEESSEDSEEKEKDEDENVELRVKESLSSTKTQYGDRHTPSIGVSNSQCGFTPHSPPITVHSLKAVQKSKSEPVRSLQTPSLHVACVGALLREGEEKEGEEREGDVEGESEKV